MQKDARHKARQRLDERLLPLKPVSQFTVPPKGWVRAIRDALGMTRMNGFTRTRTLHFEPDNEPVAPKGHQKRRITQRLLSTTPQCRQPSERESTGHRLPE